MRMFDQIRKMKIWLVIIAIFIAIASLLSSNYLINDLKHEEANNMDVWAEAMQSLNNADEYTDLNLVLKVMDGNKFIPIIVLDKDGNILTTRNLNEHFKNDEDSVATILSIASSMRSKGHSIRIFNDDEHLDYSEICYDDSLMLKRLTVYPYIQLSVVVIFVLIALFALFSSMKAEQNKVWVGLSKETAHQLGTPISSLTAWLEMLKDVYPDDAMLPEMEKDVSRLERIAERFSKIGSIPEPKDTDICDVVARVVSYMNMRVSNKVNIISHIPTEEHVVLKMVPSLFEWVLENLCKNAVDAMNGSGKIDIYITEQQNLVALEVTDTGKGMPKSNYKDVFKPGFTTKKRGWGLGLSLAKRIVEEYHKGKIFVKYSEVGKGTTFRIEIPK
ncbi:MAG: HAMP domain-containing histidine kinase [Bacteroidaceae bacterium]|nr:HAMP domain-containing histidine kinase [Bacteroidaceae bacterium]